MKKNILRNISIQELFRQSVGANDFTDVFSINSEATEYIIPKR